MTHSIIRLSRSTEEPSLLSVVFLFPLQGFGGEGVPTVLHVRVQYYSPREGKDHGEQSR